jgi:hypothetical protein
MAGALDAGRRWRRSCPPLTRAFLEHANCRRFPSLRIPDEGDHPFQSEGDHRFRSKATTDSGLKATTLGWRAGMVVAIPGTPVAIPGMVVAIPGTPVAIRRKL